MKTKNILITAIAIIVFIAGANAQNVNIPDANFKAALVSNANINTNMDTEIQLAEANGYSGSIHVSGDSITDLTGIEAFTSIDSLDCSENQIVGLDVSANIALTYLNCSSNILVIYDINNNYTITYFIDSLDVTPNLALTTLICSYNGLLSLNTTGLTALTYLDCNNNNRFYIDSMSNLMVFSYPILNFTTNTALTTLICSNNGLTNLNTTGFTALTYLDCYGNPLASLNVSANTALTNLVCAVTQLTNLDVSANTALTYLNCRLNSLTSLNVSTNTALTYLSCDDNLLTSLNVSANTALNGLVCINNQLTNLNLKNGNNINFINFMAGNNPNLSCIEVDSAAWSASNWSTSIDATAFFSENCSGVGMNTIGQTKALQVYPNPTSSNIFLTDNSNLVLTDLAGQVLLQKTNTKQMDISVLPAGIYLLHVGQNEKQTFKVIKQ